MKTPETPPRALDGIPVACHGCVENQTRSACRFAELNEPQTETMVAMAREFIRQSGREHWTTQHVVRLVADAILDELGVSRDFDMYARVKQRSNDLALAHLDAFKRETAASASPFATALQLAAAGNIIDFGAKNHGALDLEKELLTLSSTPFARYDLAPLREALAHGRTLLYLCDNAGEIVLDTLFIGQIKAAYPHLTIIAAVRDKPIINDATLADARYVGLTELVTTVSSGSVYPGTILSEVSPEFMQHFSDADVIISKGQGNFETLLPGAEPRLFFLLRVKCDYMADLAGVVKDRLILLQGN
ncbi:DUF89 family protein [Myxococcota bacterium]|nr:DUF89 family protein [Myxococcota bacterium]